jgi:hypothetical protein
LAIGFFLALAYHLPSRMDDRVFVRILAKRGGLNVSESDLTPEAMSVVIALAQKLDDETPTGLEKVTLPSGFPHLRRKQRSAAKIAETCVCEVTPDDPVAAFDAFRGLRPELRHYKGRLAKYRPVARAALRAELRKIAMPVLWSFEKQGRFVDTDSLVDEGECPAS